MLGHRDFNDYEMVIENNKYIFGLEFTFCDILFFSTDHDVLSYINLLCHFFFIAEAFTDYSGKCNHSILWL